MTFRLLDQWDSPGPTLILDNVGKRVAVVDEPGQPLKLLPAVADGHPVAAWFDGTPDRVVVHAEDARETAILYEVCRAGGGSWEEPLPFTLPPGCVPLDFRAGPRGGIVARYYRDAGGTDICWYDRDAGQLRVLHRDPGWIYCAALSPDRRHVAFLIGGPVSLSATLWLSDVEGRLPARRLHPPDGYAALGVPSWTADGAGLVFCSTYKRDFAAVLHFDLVTGACRELAASDYDLDVRALTGDGRLVLTENRDGASAVSLLDPASSAPPAALTLPCQGVATVLRRPVLGPAGELLITFTAPGMPCGVWAVATNQAPRPLQPVLAGPAAEGPQRMHVIAEDAVRVPVFDWYPSRRSTSDAPVVVALHGGPEEQWMLRHEPLFERLHQAGVAVLAADLRGSLGFGITYSSLDDGVLNFDVLRDLAAVHAGLRERGLDPRRAILLGTSFGAYQVLLALTHQSDLWAAGIAISGVSDPLSYLSQTLPHRRAQRELAYGSAISDKARLAEMSPFAGAAKITAPLLLAHGAGDVRVPVAQSRNLANAIRSAGGQVTLREFPEEGHRLGSSANRVVLYQHIMDFVTTHTHKRGHLGAPS